MGRSLVYLTGFGRLFFLWLPLRLVFTFCVLLSGWVYFCKGLLGFILFLFGYQAHFTMDFFKKN